MSRLMEKEVQDLSRMLIATVSEISETGWCAGWLDGIEDMVWDAVTGKARYLCVDEADIAALRAWIILTGTWLAGNYPPAVVPLTAQQWEQFRASELEVTP